MLETPAQASGPSTALSEGSPERDDAVSIDE